jgi:hypothetical protein
MSLFPRLEVAPLAFPKIDEYTDFRENYVCQMSSKMTTSFRESSNFHPRETDETPDVERFNEKVQLKSGKDHFFQSYLNLLKSNEFF